MTDFDRLYEWVSKNFPVETYSDVDELVRDVRDNFIQTGSHFPDSAEEIIRQNWAMVYNERDATIYDEIREKMEAEQLAADMLGSGQIPQSITDQVIQDFNKPEIMGIDIKEFRTDREDVVPPEIVKYAMRQVRPNIIQRAADSIKSTLKRIFRFGR